MSENVKSFDSQEQQQAYERLLKELRCVTCPNQSLADSSAPVAQAMQDEIYLRLKQNETVETIRQDLVSTYGDYLSYNPALKFETYGLWFGPVLMLAAGIVVWFAFFRSKRNYDK